MNPPDTPTQVCPLSLKRVFSRVDVHLARWPAAEQDERLSDTWAFASSVASHTQQAHHPPTEAGRD
jgi:hypothetical protein